MFKKIIAWMLLITVTATVAVGGTLAYLTDRDSEANVFTVGDVDITLDEKFEENSELLPGKDIEKDVAIKNEGPNDAWVWYTYAVPSALDDYLVRSFEENDDWRQLTDMIGTKEVDGVTYNVYAVLHKEVVENGDTTSVSLTKVQMDPAVDITPDGELYKVVAGETTKLDWNVENGPVIYVDAFAIQKEGFASVEEAYNAFQEQWDGASAIPVPTYVTTWEELQAVASVGGYAVLGNDISGATTIDMNGGIIDGNGYTMNFTNTDRGAVVIDPTGGTIENVSIVKENPAITPVQYAIGSLQMKETTLTEDLYVENVTISGLHMALDLNANGHNVYVSDGEIANWIQVAEAGITSFENCHFVADAAGEMTYNKKDYQGLIFPLGSMTFTDCHFEENINIYLDSYKYSGDMTFNGCTYGNNGVEDRPFDSFGFISWWMNAFGIHGYKGTFGEDKPAQTNFNWYIDGELVWEATGV